MKWAEEKLPENRRGVSVSLDAKSICSTGKMYSYDSPLHIVSAQLCELGITLASKSVDGKRNKIPVVQELLKELDLSGCMIAADASNCQKTNGWHYYIFNRKLTVLELLHYVRMEWTVESIHWLLNVHFSEDFLPN